MRDDGSEEERVYCSSSSSTRSRSRSRSRSPTSLFEDSLFTLFSHNQPAHGDPGDVCKYTHTNLPPRKIDSSSGSAPRKATLRYRIAQNSGTNTKLFAHHQWDAGLYLADLIAEQSFVTTQSQAASEVALGKQRDAFADVRGKTVVELGAGTGLPGLVACVMGAAKTVITDYPDPHVIENLQGNLDLALLSKPNTAGNSSQRRPNPHYAEARTRVEVLGLGWGNHDEEARVYNSSLSSGGSGGGYDVVLAADVLWVSSAHPLLIHSIRALLKRDRNARCVLIAGFHTGRPAVRRFFVQLAQADTTGDGTLADGRTAGIVPDWEEASYAGIWERNIDGATRAYSDTEDDMGDISDRGSWVVVASLRWADLV
ncbi:hypothetical protein PaG_02742 [Moesziomyces aphidis]|uniref:Nicotinamide N-methyltransferase n=1 Tax=Moesziomyces aphidis TaxID=84754 RepID=W3VQA8_MOEAP|nr:hypothetical protein PaG_02742 [Moesziomyces aphidis]